MNEALRKNEKYITKYMQKHQMLTVLLNKENDEDIIKFLWNQDNRSEVVRKAIREYIKKHGRKAAH